MGNINAISTSKIKKMIAIKKKWIEKGNRGELKGSNPHSNGEFFSRSIFFFFDRIVAKNITIKAIINIILIIVIIKNIIYIKLNKLYDWKSYILFILYKYVSFLINKLKYTKIIIQRLQNVNIRRLLRSQSGDFWKNDL